MKTRNNDIPVMPSHIEDERLIAFLDGEVETESQKEMQVHLESCWDCRSRLSNVERSIENFLRLRQEKLLPPEMPPSGPALDLFRERLASHRSLVPSHSFFRSNLPSLRALSRRISNLLNVRNYSLRTQVLMARATAAIVLVSIVTGLILLSGRFNTVSASELLQLSIDAQADQISATEQPVVYQRIQVRTASGSDRVPPVTWEIWNDTVNSRTKISAKGGVDAASADGVVLSDLRSILKANRMSEHRPLSAASYQAWTNSLAGKTEDVVRENDTLTIHTVAAEPIAIGGILEARFSVRATDYHPTSLYLRTRTNAGQQEFEIAEQDFEIVSLKNTDPAIFSEGTVVAVNPEKPVAPKVGPSVSEPPALAGGTNANTESLSTTPTTATTEAEVEVLDLLNKVGADISEHLNVTRTADGRLLVEGLVETDKRKTEILQALSPVANNPAIRIRVQTIEEAARALAKQKQQSQPGTVDRVEVEKGSLPVDSELRQYFAGRGGDTDEQIRRFASRSINHSQSALFQASALRRLANRFTADQLKALTPEARAKWLGILKGYASAVRRETANLRGELQPVFGDFSSPPAGGGVAAASADGVVGDADLIASAKRLYELASANDRVVRSALTLSSGSATVSAIKTPQFRRSLGSAESLASAIERAK